MTLVKDIGTKEKLYPYAYHSDGTPNLGKTTE
jgi:hypothetical protein